MDETQWLNLCKINYNTIREKVFNLEVSNLWRKDKLAYRDLKRAEKYYKNEINKTISRINRTETRVNRNISTN